jgi:hypothetical protein
MTMTPETIEAASAVLVSLAMRMQALSAQYMRENDARMSRDDARHFHMQVVNQYDVVKRIAEETQRGARAAIDAINPSRSAPGLEQDLQRAWRTLGAANAAWQRESQRRVTHGEVWSREVMSQANTLFQQASPVVTAVAEAGASVLSGIGMLGIAAAAAVIVVASNKKG